MMFVFEDIRLLDDRTVQKVMQEIPDKKDLAIALRGVSDEVKDKILRNMSKRAAATLQEDMDFMGPMRLKDVEDAQQRIVEVIRKLEEAGDIIIERGGQSQFV
jgi:flagellar motor switch protein FliG